MWDVIVRGGFSGLTHLLACVWPITQAKNFKRYYGRISPLTSSWHKIFNKNNIKLSYSCMSNVANLINKSNTKKLMNK